MGSGGVHKSLGPFEFMILIRRKTGKLRGDRVRCGRPLFALALPVLLACLLPSLAGVKRRRAKFYSLTAKGRRRRQREVARWLKHANAVASVLRVPTAWAD